MAVKITQCTVAGGRTVDVGEVYEGGDEMVLVRMGKAVMWVDATPAPEYTEPEPTVEMAVSIEDAGPDFAWTRAQIKEWLDDHGISYDERASKAELLDLVG